MGGLVRFKKKGVIVTGGAKGIGFAITQAFEREGAIVFVLDIDSEAQNIKALGKHVTYIQCDVGNADSVKRAFDQITTKSAEIHYLINNAGIQHYGSVTETSENEWDRVMDINLKGCFLCAKYALPLMKKGAVVNMSSAVAFLTQARTAPYCTSKTALLGLTRSIAVDYAPNIRCVAVCPGTIDTPLVHNAFQTSKDPAKVLHDCEEMHLVKRMGKAEEVASLVLYLCSEEAEFITGQAYRIDGGLGIQIPGSQE